MNRAKFRVSFELLENLLMLPEDSRIIGILAEPHLTMNRMFEVGVSHPDLPEHIEGADLPEVAPVYKTDDRGPRFESWGDVL